MAGQSSVAVILLSRTRAFVVGALISAMAGAAASAVIYHEERNILLEREGARLANRADRTATMIDRQLDAWLRDIVALAEFGPLQREPIDRPVARDTLEMIRRLSPAFSWIGLADREGRVIVATRGMLEGADVTGKPWFSAGQRGRYLGDVHHAAALAPLLPAEEGGENAYFLDAAAPVRRHDGHVAGVVGGHMNWQWVVTLRDEMLGAATYRGSLDLLIADREDRVLVGGEGQGSPATRTALALPPAPMERTARWLLHQPAGGPDLIVAAMRTAGDDGNGFGWSVHVSRHVAEVVAPANDLLTWLTLGSILIALVGGATAAVASNVVSRAVRILAGQARGVSTEESLAWVRRRLVDLQSAAHRDRLTGLLNRAGFDAWRQSHPHPGESAQLIAFDLNGFKPVNDTHGHAVGDEVLVALGAWLRDRVRAGDAAVRLGGDEFVVCLAGAPRAAADRFVSHLRDFLADGISTSAGPLPLGCSVGLIAVPAIGAAMDAALREADRAMYGEKRRSERARAPDFNGTE